MATDSIVVLYIFYCIGKNCPPPEKVVKTNTTNLKILTRYFKKVAPKVYKRLKSDPNPTAKLKVRSNNQKITIVRNSKIFIKFLQENCCWVNFLALFSSCKCIPY